MPSRRPVVPPLALVVAAVVSVQFGGALAATLVPDIGAAGSVTLRLLFRDPDPARRRAAPAPRPRRRGLAHRGRPSASPWALMNLAFYGSLAHLPIGVAVTIEFLGPLTLATVLSRRARDLPAVAAAAFGVVLISRALQVPLSDLEWTGLGLAALAGACWAAYILASGRTGQLFPRLDGPRARHGRRASS